MLLTVYHNLFVMDNIVKVKNSREYPTNNLLKRNSHALGASVDASVGGHHICGTMSPLCVIVTCAQYL